MTKTLRILFGALCAFSAAAVATAAKVGEPAPAFTLTSIEGKTHSLSEFKGKTVVLEWFNSKCPFVVKHYKNGDMQRLQKAYADKGVVWLLVNSTSPKHQDYFAPDAHMKLNEEWKVAAAATLLDPEGTVGRAYDARTTPHMYVINPEGVLVYAGAIDSIRSANSDDVAKADNYVVAALDAVLSGGAVANAATRPYGCSVKYN